MAAGAMAAFLATAAGWPGAAQAATAAHRVPAGQVRELSRSATAWVPGGEGRLPEVAPLRHLLQAGLLVVSSRSLPAGALAAVASLPGVKAAQLLDAVRVKVDGEYTAVLGVNPSRFRAFAARPTAKDTAFWRSVAAGDIGVSYTMGRQAKLPAGSMVEVAGRKLETLRVGGLGTVAIPGIDAVISHRVARSLGFPMGNAIVISAASTHQGKLKSRLKAVLPHGTAVEPLTAPPSAGAAANSTAGQAGGAAGAALTPAQATVMLRAAASRVGLPYVWGAAGPAAFDCSGLVQWSFAQAGVVMPRVAADQARTGPAVPVSRLVPGDLLFYHTDPTAPGYISHVAIYLGQGLMIQAPEPGRDVEIVPVNLGSGFAGAISVSPRIAAQVAAAPVG